MQAIIYIGNFLGKWGQTPTFNETLVAKLVQSYHFFCASDRRNIALRLLHMAWILIRHRKQGRLVMIDVYSGKAFWFATMAVMLARLLGMRPVPILHGGNLPCRLAANPRLCRYLFAGRTLISPSHYLAAVFGKQGYHVRCIPNFIPLADYPYKQRQVLAPKLLWVRAFHHIYNPHLAVEIVARLLPRFPHAQLCMVGPDKDGSKAQLEHIITERGLAENITLTGLLTKQRWTALAADYDLFINTTNVDNQPVSVIEAMALGLPVISTNVGGLPFLIEDRLDGILVPPDNAEAFVTAIETLLADQESARELALRAREKAATHDWQTINQQWLGTIDELLQ